MSTSVRRASGGSGQGFVLLEDGGTVLSVVNKGANHGWDIAGCDDAWAAEVVQNARVVLLQREVPERINEVVARAAQKAGAIVVQDCGGEEREMSDEHLARCTYVAPNVSELARLTGRDLDRKDALIRRRRRVPCFNSKARPRSGYLGRGLSTRLEGRRRRRRGVRQKGADETAAATVRARPRRRPGGRFDERTASHAAGAAAVTKEGAHPLTTREERDALLGPTCPVVAASAGGGLERRRRRCPWRSHLD